jgi:hypothetical protein
MSAVLKQALEALELVAETPLVRGGVFVLDQQDMDFARKAAKALRDELFDEYGNPTDGSELINCCFPDCGCDGARLCMAKSGASSGARCLNIERGSLGVKS